MEGFQYICQRWTIEKDKDSVLDYSWDWRKWLAYSTPADTIVSHTITVADSPTASVVSSTVSNGVVTAVISGGEVGDLIKLTCSIVTDAPHEDSRTFYLKVVEK
jgi:hypothetical protein